MYNILCIGCGFVKELFLVSNVDKFININNINNVTENTKINPKYKFIELNNKLFNDFSNIIRENEITHIINFLSNGIDNFNIVFNLLKECEKYKELKFIHVSTDKILSDRMSDNRVNILSDNTSSLSSCIELIVRTSILKPIIIRSCKLYHKNINNFITKFIDLLRQNKVLEIKGSGSDTLGLLHIKDFCYALKLIIRQGEDNKVYDVCPDKLYTIVDIARELCYLFWKDDSSMRFKRQESEKLFRFALNNDSIKKIGWVQNISLSEGLKKMI